jgi:dipeptidyl aminopeptidase/acylaminoacyl peptidase
MQQRVTFKSDGLDLAGILHIPDGMKAKEKRPAIMVLHGFGTNKDGATPLEATKILEGMGYIVLRFDMRGCGESGGEPAYILCQDQVRDTQAAATYLQSLKQVDPKRIGVLGHSFGAAVAVYAGGVDKRLGAVIAVGGWGDGVAKFREQHKSAAQWKKFIMKLEQGRRHRAKTGKSLMMPRFDIVPIPVHLRKNLVGNAIMEFPAETAMSMMDFRANDVVADISPRPLLLLHPANDTVTPTSQAVGLFMRAKQPADMHLVSGVDHFMLNDDQGLVKRILEDWLAKHFPV